MARVSKALVKDLRSRFVSLEKTRVKMEKLFNKKELSKRDIEKVYESLYIRTFTFFEGFVEELFFGLLTKKIKSSVGEVVVKVSFKSEISAREIVFAGRPYYDWFPYDNTERIAKRFLKDGLPFTLLNLDESVRKDVKKDIANLLIIRNVIAHQSTYSKNRFQKEIISNALGLLPREKTPSGFLRSQFRVPDQTRFENYQLRIIDIAQKLAG